MVITFYYLFVVSIYLFIAYMLFQCYLISGNHKNVTLFKIKHKY